MAVRPIDGNTLIEWFRPYLHTGEAYMASNGAWMRHDGFPWEVDAWMPMPDRRPPEGDADA